MAAFAHYLTKWTNERGVPLSWRHYAVGMGWIGRHVAREQLRAFSPVRMAQVEIEQQDRERWLNRVNASAEW